MLILLGALAVAVLVVVANVGRARSQVRDVEVHLRYGRTPALVSEQAVRDTVLAALPRLTSLRVQDVDCEAVAAAAARVPYLTAVHASTSVSGKVVVRAQQRRPVARLFYGDRQRYIDAEGVVMPLSTLGNCNVLVAGGDFREPLRADSIGSQLRQLVALADFLDSHEQYGCLVDQIYIESDDDVMMVPKVGDHIIELGTVENLDEKFENLLTFYRKGMPRAGWNTYSKVSLKFRNQVVCTKNN
jgi:cell division protein FtsQ